MSPEVRLETQDHSPVGMDLGGGDRVLGGEFLNGVNGERPTHKGLANGKTPLCALFTGSVGGGLLGDQGVLLGIPLGKCLEARIGTKSWRKRRMIRDEDMPIVRIEQLFSGHAEADGNVCDRMAPRGVGSDRTGES